MLTIMMKILIMYSSTDEEEEHAVHSGLVREW